MHMCSSVGKICDISAEFVGEMDQSNAHIFTFCLSCRTDILIWWKSSHVAEQVPVFMTLSDFSKRCTAGKWENVYVNIMLFLENCQENRLY